MSGHGFHGIADGETYRGRGPARERVPAELYRTLKEDTLLCGLCSNRFPRRHFLVKKSLSSRCETCRRKP